MSKSHAQHPEKGKKGGGRGGWWTWWRGHGWCVVCGGTRVAAAGAVDWCKSSSTRGHGCLDGIEAEQCFFVVVFESRCAVKRRVTAWLDNE